MGAARKAEPTRLPACNSTSARYNTLLAESYRRERRRSRSSTSPRVSDSVGHTRQTPMSLSNFDWSARNQGNILDGVDTTWNPASPSAGRRRVGLMVFIAQLNPQKFPLQASLLADVTASLPLYQRQRHRLQAPTARQALQKFA